MNFKAKIFLATLSILITTLLLNSVMSIFSFEKNYVESLISTYEVAGDAMKRKIEQSLRLGKPLDKFQGMDRLFEKVAGQNRHISMIRIHGKDGDVLYEFAKTGSEGVSDFSPDQGGLPVVKELKTVLVKNHYLTMVPLEDAGGTAGMLYLSFPETVIFEKVKQMIISNLNILWPVLVSTCFALIFLLALLIFRPLKKELVDITGLFESGEEKGGDPIPAGRSDFSSERDRENLENSGKQPDYYAAGFDIRQVKSEIDMLKKQIEFFMAHYAGTMQKIEKLNQQQNSIFLLEHKLQQCEIQLENIRDEADCLSIQAVIDESFHTRELLALLREIVKDMGEVCTRDSVCLPNGEGKL
ncbi:MAG: hypothetical protein ACQETC_08540 [Thermodesulfobacteriota bacterium]